MQIVEHTSQILRLRAKRGLYSSFGIGTILLFSLTFSLFGLVALVFGDPPADLLGGIFMLAGGAIFLGFGLPKQIVSCIFDKTYNQASLKRENVFLQSTTTEEKLDNIKMAQIDESFDSDDGYNYNINLILKSGKSIYLGTFKNRSELAEAINQFLDVNEQ